MWIFILHRAIENYNKQWKKNYAPITMGNGEELAIRILTKSNVEREHGSILRALENYLNTNTHAVVFFSGDWQDLLQGYLARYGKQWTTTTTTNTTRYVDQAYQLVNAWLASNQLQTQNYILIDDDEIGRYYLN
ncbi:MAG: hypothetical protein KF716_33600 [Anaerolineae bacterium]|nr:hypothetical protein [Anaerolineae bacterium]